MKPCPPINDGQSSPFDSHAVAVVNVKRAKMTIFIVSRLMFPRIVGIGKASCQGWPGILIYADCG